MSVRIPLSAPDITQAEIDAVTAVLRTPHLCFGPELAAFEAALAGYHSVDHAVAVSSGTAGLHLALVTLGVGEGDEVIVPSFAFVAVANTVRQVRAAPVFAEIDPFTLNLDPASVEGAITPRTRAIVVVHTFGVPAEMDASLSIARRHGLALIEDACEAIGAEFDCGPRGQLRRYVRIWFLSQQADHDGRRRRGVVSQCEPCRAAAQSAQPGPLGQRVARPR